ncbi:GntR family trehalose operon transcriptional repressor [Youngiibacter multivorans]|uniref:Trehalose operon repressor n=2 Tax=Youngiibacter multivorans TaxID=937251 RepID=A0ABS4G340_9CLOT|nr:GntR family trehalose operon transcriptional repressor [Youngiibacter multivorans]
MIKDGTLKSRDKLPSENELMAEYGISRDTVRKSLQLLLENGFITKIRGKGSFVTELTRFEFPVAGLITFKELSSSKVIGNSATKVINLKSCKGNPYVREKLGLENDAEIWAVTRVRTIDGRRVILDKDHFVKSIVENLTIEICEDSIYEYLENELGLKIGYAHKEIVIERATEEDERNLDLMGFDVVAVVNTLVYLQNGTLLQYTQSRHCPDKFRFVDIARRNP